MVVEERAKVKEFGDFVRKYTRYSRLRSNYRGYLNVTDDIFSAQTNINGVIQLNNVGNLDDVSSTNSINLTNTNITTSNDNCRYRTIVAGSD